MRRCSLGPRRSPKVEGRNDRLCACGCSSGALEAAPRSSQWNWNREKSKMSLKCWGSHEETKGRPGQRLGAEEARTAPTLQVPQGELARLLDCSAMTVSRSENGQLSRRSRQRRQTG